MAEVNSSGNVNSLYPQPTQNTGFDPSKVLGIVGQINQNNLFQKEFAAKQAVGEAAQGAIGPDGTYSPSANMNALSSNPAAAFGAPEAITGVIAKQGAQLEQNQAQVQHAAGVYGAISNIEKPTASDVHKATALIASSNPNIPAPLINQMAQTILADPLGIKHGAATLQNIAIGPSGTSGRVAAPPAPGGAPQSQSVGAANYRGTTSTGLPPGEEGLLGAPTERAARLQASASTSPQYHADLDNLKQDSKILDNLGGPTFETEKKLNQLSSRLAGIGITMTPDQLKAGESFDKIANQISLNQSQLFHGSDAGLHTVVGANPSSSMSKYGREGVIDMLQGNQDAIDITRKAWLKARANGAPASSYDQFAETIGQELDPRVFQFNRLSRDNQQKFLSQMEPEDVGPFEEKYKSAVARKWVKPLKAPDSGK